MTTAADPRTRPVPSPAAALDPDQPVPFALTAKAHAALGQEEDTAAESGSAEWGCERCGAAYFGTPPDDGLCLACRAGEHGR